ncbi:MAG: site-specific recombinase XerD [bacterium]|jgi:site-specific recombinase XerD
MEKNYTHNISFILDTRRVKKNNKFPVKLRVYSKKLGKAKLYNTDIDLTKGEFNRIWIDGNSTNLRGSNRTYRTWLQKFENRANDEAEKLALFSFNDFERKFFRKSTDGNNLIHHYIKTIESRRAKGKIGTADSFKCSLNSITKFNTLHTGKEAPIFSFDSITVDWLEAYEESMLTKGKSIASVGIYLRSLRIIFNKAIEDGDIKKDIYPFGKRRYQIPKSSKVKKALSNIELGTLFRSNPKTIEQAKAKDFWLLSYACSGMNFKDVLLLEFSDIKGDKFSYYRAKTFSKSSIKTKINIYLNDFSKGVIEKYCSKNKNEYVFPILNKRDSEEVKYRKIKNFTKFVNQHIKKLAKDNNLPEDISPIWARHSFTTNSIRKGASMEFISEALNHSDLSVTKNYFAGFEDETKKEFANKLMDF